MNSKIRSLFGRNVLTLILTTFFSIFLVTLSLFADDCTESQTFCDTGCNNDTNCPPTSVSGIAGCTSTNFIPSCGGTYYLSTWTSCATTNCAHCMSCATIYDGSTLLAFCKTGDCVLGSEYCCKSCGTVSLTSGHTYTVKVCLSRCPGDIDCTTCGNGGCQACACIKHEDSSSCCP